MTESEWQTRKQRIDARLRSMNPPWQFCRYRDGLDFAALDYHAVEELPTATGPADYALFVGGSLFALADQLEVRLAKACWQAWPAEAVRRRLDQLTPSVLARAFAGKLVSQDPNDEPASNLLARIRAQTKSKSRRDARK